MASYCCLLCLSLELKSIGMKKICLLLSVAMVSITATAQQRARNILFNDHSDNIVMAPQPGAVNVHPTFERGRTSRTTVTSSGRWYNYADYLTSNYTIGYSANYLWNDTTSVDAYSGGTGTQFLFNTIVSVGLVCDPFVAGWNDAASFPGMMNLTPADAYVIDSVFISGVYYRNNDKPTPVDTLTLAVIYGDGSMASDLHAVARDTTGGREWIYTQYGVDTLHYIRMPHDSINNHADTFDGGAAPVVSKIYLTSADTSANYQAVVPVSINVPAGGNLPALSLSFKSGDASFTFGDTVFQGSGSGSLYKYGMFRPLVAFEGTSAAVDFPVNSASDRNQGQFRYAGANCPHHIYTPQWFWTSSAGGAATLQYPYFAFHLSCPACTPLGVDNTSKNIKGVNVAPNPANNVLSINFGLVAAADVSVLLTNVMGQVVATENSTGTANGKISINTSAMPAGVYFYTLVANGERFTGRVVVSH